MSMSPWLRQWKVYGRRWCTLLKVNTNALKGISAHQSFHRIGFQHIQPTRGLFLPITTFVIRSGIISFLCWPNCLFINWCMKDLVFRGKNQSWKTNCFIRQWQKNATDSILSIPHKYRKQVGGPHAYGFLSRFTDYWTLISDIPLIQQALHDDLLTTKDHVMGAWSCKTVNLVSKYHH